MEVGEIEKFNPWWKTGKVREEWLKDTKENCTMKF